MKKDSIFTGNLKLKEASNNPIYAGVGFRFGDRGTHTSRTMMFEELKVLLRECPREATRSDYETAVIEDNCLQKKTLATRKLSQQRLSELYGLDSSVVLFRILRLLWYGDEKGQPLLALLITVSRDPLLRITAPVIMEMGCGEELARQKMTDILRDGTHGRFNDNVLDKVVRNTASSWTQSGHLKGRGRKVRQLVQPTPAVTAYALLLGYILGLRGDSLFSTLWSRLLDVTADELRNLAVDAKRLGFLDLSQLGGVTEISFTRLLTEEERRLIHGTN